ncbi:hypothetical protein DFH09DRAFT_1169457 [Mycena vulgaris]|nr:hypothetical protein DFH09DRAFT_1169457 [Mycena vulgaris]
MLEYGFVIPRITFGFAVCFPLLVEPTPSSGNDHTRTPEASPVVSSSAVCGGSSSRRIGGMEGVGPGEDKLLSPSVSSLSLPSSLFSFFRLPTGTGPELFSGLIPSFPAPKI